MANGSISTDLSSSQTSRTCDLWKLMAWACWLRLKAKGGSDLNRKSCATGTPARLRHCPSHPSPPGTVLLKMLKVDLVHLASRTAAMAPRDSAMPGPPLRVCAERGHVRINGPSGGGQRERERESRLDFTSRGHGGGRVEFGFENVLRWDPSEAWSDIGGGHTRGARPWSGR